MTGVNGHVLYAHRIICQKCKEEQGIIRERVKRVVGKDKRIIAVCPPGQLTATIQGLRLPPNSYKIEEFAPFEAIPTICKKCVAAQVEEVAKAKETVEAGGVFAQCGSCGSRAVLDKDHFAAIEARKVHAAPKHVLVTMECDQCIATKAQAAPSPSLIIQ